MSEIFRSKVVDLLWPEVGIGLFSSTSIFTLTLWWSVGFRGLDDDDDDADADDDDDDDEVSCFASPMLSSELKNETHKVYSSILGDG